RFLPLDHAENSAFPRAKLARYLRCAALAQRRQHATLALQTLCPLLSETLDTGKDGLGVEMRLSNDVRLQSTGEPLIIPVGGQLVGVRRRPRVFDGPYTPRSRTHHHEVIERLRWQHRVAIGLGLAIEQLFTDGRNNFHVDARLLQAW